MNNHPLPQWATQKWRDSNLTVMDKMRRVDAFQFDVKFDHPVQRKLTGGQCDLSLSLLSDSVLMVLSLQVSF